MVWYVVRLSCSPDLAGGCAKAEVCFSCSICWEQHQDVFVVSSHVVCFAEYSFHLTRIIIVLDCMVLNCFFWQYFQLYIHLHLWGVDLLSEPEIVLLVGSQHEHLLRRVQSLPAPLNPQLQGLLFLDALMINSFSYIWCFHECCPTICMVRLGWCVVVIQF